jgi:hypothetical protein
MMTMIPPSVQGDNPIGDLVQAKVTRIGHAPR